jgi:hypothetical protein
MIPIISIGRDLASVNADGALRVRVTQEENPA